MTLDKAVAQKHLTRDTIDAQFCSTWLKSEIHRLFDILEHCRGKHEYCAIVEDALQTDASSAGGQSNE